MSIVLKCPSCDDRSVGEFHYGGEVRQKDAAPSWWHYVYDRTNERGIQKEWWYHRYGCQKWFHAVRDTRTNQVRETMEIIRNP